MLPEAKTSKPARSPNRARSRHIAAAAVVIALLGSGTGFWIAGNARASHAQALAIRRALQRDHRSGVPLALIRRERQHLSLVDHARVALLPATDFAPLDGVNRDLRQLHRTAAHLVRTAKTQEIARTVSWGDKLVAAEGQWARPLSRQTVAQRSHHASLRQLLSLNRQWQAQYRVWKSTLRHLSSLGGGLNHDRPKLVLRRLRQIQIRYAHHGQFWDGVSQAKAAIVKTEAYLKKPPSEELAQFHGITAILQQASLALRPPSQYQLLQVLAGRSHGLIRHQPRDIVVALNQLERRIAAANHTWRGYSEAQSAKASALRYLKSPIRDQIDHHQSIKSDLDAAAAQLTPPPQPPASSVSLTEALHRYLATRTSQVSAAVYNANTGAFFTFDPGVQFDTASIVKATIMATLLWQSQISGHSLTLEEQNLMVPMIEVSSNTAATSLWFDAGGAAGIADFLHAAGMTQTQPGLNGYWGLTRTTALDQVRLLKLLAYPNEILDGTSRAHALRLMQNVEYSERWGISTGAPADATVALKNGWLPLPSVGWEINSIGYVNGDGRNYVVALLSCNNPTEAYGIQSLNGVSQLIWNAE